MTLPALEEGDVVFTVDGSHTLMHAVIATAQRVGSPGQGGHANSIHAAIATGQGFDVFESIGSGIRKTPLAPGKYRVYRYKGVRMPEIRSSAAMIAESFAAHRQLDPGFGDYNKRKATLSTVRKYVQKEDSNIVQFGSEAKAHTRFFCSNFVWRCYIAAGELLNITIPNSLGVPIPMSHSQLSPRDLERMLSDSRENWTALNDGHSMQH